MQCSLPAVQGTKYCAPHLSDSKCKMCCRRLRPGLFVTDANVCNACMRKTKYLQEQKGLGSARRSVNGVFIEKTITADVNKDVDPVAFLRDRRQEFLDTMREGLALHGSLKTYLTLELVMERGNGDEQQLITSRFCNPAAVLLRPDEIEEHIDEAADTIMERIEGFTELGSDWKMQNIRNFEISMSAYDPIGGSAYIRTPDRVANTKGIVT